MIIYSALREQLIDLGNDDITPVVDDEAANFSSEQLLVHQDRILLGILE